MVVVCDLDVLEFFRMYAIDFMCSSDAYGHWSIIMQDLQPLHLMRWQSNDEIYEYDWFEDDEELYGGIGEMSEC